MRSPPRSRSAAFAGAPFTSTRRSSMSSCTRARERLGQRSTTKRSSRVPRCESAAMSSVRLVSGFMGANRSAVHLQTRLEPLFHADCAAMLASKSLELACLGSLRRFADDKFTDPGSSLGGRHCRRPEKACFDALGISLHCAGDLVNCWNSFSAPRYASGARRRRIRLRGAVGSPGNSAVSAGLQHEAAWDVRRLCCDYGRVRPDRGRNSSWRYRGKRRVHLAGVPDQQAPVRFHGRGCSGSQLRALLDPPAIARISRPRHALRRPRGAAFPLPPAPRLGLRATFTLLLERSFFRHGFVDEATGLLLPGFCRPLPALAGMGRAKTLENTIQELRRVRSRRSTPIYRDLSDSPASGRLSEILVLDIFLCAGLRLGTQPVRRIAPVC